MSYDPDDFDNNPFAQPSILLAPVASSESPLPPTPAKEEEPPTPPKKDEVPKTNAEPKPEANLLKFLPERRSKKNFFIKIQVSGIERVARKEPIVKFLVQTSLPSFRAATFKDVRRTYGELERFFEHLNGANPECFVPSLPAPQTSYGPGASEDEAALTQLVQEWFDRVTLNPILIRNDEFVYFVENDAGYSPVNKGRVPATGLRRKTLKQFQPPFDENTELVAFRPYIKSIYLGTQEAHRTFERAAKLRKSFGLQTVELGHKITELATMETKHPGMANLWHKFGRCLVVYGDIEAVKLVFEMALFGDPIQQLSSDLYVIKEQLTNRQLLMRDLVSAEQTTRAKHAQAVKAKTRRYEDPGRIDQIITELEESKKTEDLLRSKVQRVLDNMLIEKKEVLAYQDRRIRSILRKYIEKEIETERRALSNFEKIRLDVRLVDENGGLSRLGRENYPRIGLVRVSQRADGDDWSGDRKARRGLTDTKPKVRVTEGEFDAKTAASLLGTLTF